MKERIGKGRIATIIACALWLLSIVLSFAIPPNSPLIWIPDSILLAGFLPLLFLKRWSWTWIIFGILNMGIGFLLLTIEVMPDVPPPPELPLPPELVVAKHHLKDYHPSWSWMIIGALCTIYGSAQALVNIGILIWQRIKTK